MNNEAVFDFETLSLKAWDCVAVTMAVVFFDRERFISDNPYDFSLVDEVFNYKIDAQVQVKDFKYSIEEETLEWWKSQPKEVRKAILPTKDDLHPEEFCKKLLRDTKTKTKKLQRWYSRGNNFDPVILRRIMHDNGLAREFDKIYPFWAVRDTRTTIDEALGTSDSFVPCADPNKWTSWFKHHDAAYDVVADVLRLQVVERVKHDLEPLTL